MGEALKRNLEGAEQAVDREQRESMDAYDELLGALDGPADHWDRPDGDWGAVDAGDRAARTEARQVANSGYLLGTEALRRGDVERAIDWFSVGADEQHPGAPFRWGAAESRRAGIYYTTGNGKSVNMNVFHLVMQAGAWGHGDAQRLVSRVRARGDEPAVIPDGGARNVCSPHKRGWSPPPYRASWGGSSSPRTWGRPSEHIADLQDLGLLPAHAGVEPRSTPASFPLPTSRVHGDTPLHSGSNIARTMLWPALDVDILDQLTLVPDEEPYRPQDPEFYPEVRRAFEACFDRADDRGASGAAGEAARAPVENAAAPHPSVAPHPGTTGADAIARKAGYVQLAGLPGQAAPWASVLVASGIGLPIFLESLGMQERASTCEADRVREDTAVSWKRYVKEAQRSGIVTQALCDRTLGSAFLVDALVSLLQRSGRIARQGALRDLVAEPACRALQEAVQTVTWLTPARAAQASVEGSRNVRSHFDSFTTRFTSVQGFRPIELEVHPSLSVNTAVPTDIDTLLASSRYPGPEKVPGQGPSTPADLYALGCVMHELLLREEMFRANRSASGPRYEVAGMNSRRRIPSTGRPDLEELLMRLLDEALRGRSAITQTCAQLGELLGTGGASDTTLGIRLAKYVPGANDTMLGNQHRTLAQLFETANTSCAQVSA
ncbi:hypothetical protein GCM10022420_070880 [Streptomyces iranensis]